MKNLRYFPFERNLFFKGKLLTVRDFESEQKYFNDKRRLLNRLLHGIGVVSGLQVVRVDDKQISLESGVALDNLGREIVVASPVKMKLSMIDGFKNNEYAKNVYLCISYDEKGKEQVYSVNNTSSSADEQSEYNRVMESYKIFIKEEAPDPASFENSNQFESICVIYDDSQVRIIQKTPLYVNPGEIFELKLQIEKTIQTPKIVFEYVLDSEKNFTLEQDDAKITFEEPLDGQATDYEVSFYVKAGITPIKGEIAMKSDSAKLSIGDKLLHITKEDTNSIEIITGSVNDRLLADYHDRSLDKSVEFTSDQCIYLAKICLLQMGSTYMIEKIDPVPFGEYIYNASILNKLSGKGGGEGTAIKTGFHAKSSTVELNANEIPKFTVSYNEESNQFDFKLGLPKTQRVSNDVTMGYVEIPLKSKGIKPFSKPEKSFFSDEIDHFLGDGHIFVVTGLEEMSGDPISGMLNRSEQVYFGDNDVFKDTQFESEITNVSIGTIIYPQKGTFRIGVKPQGSSSAASVRVHWWAFKQLTEQITADDQSEAQETAVSDSNIEAAAGNEENS
ncbi:MAG: hypothetical protein JWM44_2060 [Bacilli bacterium]|nr:hypothetical protein [Bacilli bacterium]